MPRITVAPHTPALAADFNAVSDQSIMRFATAAARTAAIPTPTLGMHTFLDDTKYVYLWNGTAWQIVTPFIKGGNTSIAAGSDGSGFFSITHGAGFTPVWASVTMFGATSVARICKAHVLGMDASIVSCQLFRTDSGNPQGGGGAFDVAWVVGRNAP